MFTETIKVTLKRLIGAFKYKDSCERASYFKTNEIKDSCDAVVVIAAHGRLEILRQVVSHLLAFRDTDLAVSLSVVVCVSELKDAERLASFFSDNQSLHIIRCANQPLGNKWQQVVSYAKLLNPKALIVCGSDDLLSYAYLSECLSHSKNDDQWALCGPAKWHMADADSEVYAVRYKGLSPVRILGSGRVYSETFLKQIDWQLFDRFLDSGLDYKGLSMVKNKGRDKLHIIDTEFTVMSVKGSWSMLNSFDDIRMSDRLLTERLSAESAKQCLQEFGLQ